MSFTQVDQADLDAAQVQAESINTRINALIAVLRQGNLYRALSLAQVLQEANCQHIHALIALGARDSAMPAGGWSTVPDDDVEPIDVEQLDLSALAALVEGER